MENITIGSIIALLRDGGITAGVILVLIGGFRRWWVFGREYDAVVTERDEWRRLALTSQDIARHAVDIGSELVK